jgi:hypothetical protein
VPGGPCAPRPRVPDCPGAPGAPSFPGGPENFHSIGCVMNSWQTWRPLIARLCKKNKNKIIYSEFPNLRAALGIRRLHSLPVIRAEIINLYYKLGQKRCPNLPVHLAQGRLAVLVAPLDPGGLQGIGCIPDRRFHSPGHCLIVPAFRPFHVCPGPQAVRVGQLGPVALGGNDWLGMRSLQMGEKERGNNLTI